MRKIVLYTLAASLVITMAGCLKDKGFEDQKYGIQIKEMKGVAFPESPSSPIVVGLNSQTAAQTVQGPYITLEEDKPAAKDVKVTIALNNALVTAAGYTVLPVGSFSASTLNVTIPAGEKFSDVIKLTFPNTSLLDATLEYAIGFTITTADQGYSIASNMKEVLFVFTIKNKYDGVYKLTLRVDGWAAYGISSGATAVYPANFELITAGANAVTINALPPSGFANLQPGFTGGVGSITGATGFGATTPKYSFDIATDKAISVVNTTPDDGRGRTLFLDPASTTSGYTFVSPAPKTIKLEYFMTQTGRPNQKITALYEYVRAR
jgi:Domain of unknown function (DUF1735)